MEIGCSYFGKSNIESIENGPKRTIDDKRWSHLLQMNRDIVRGKY